MVIPKMARPITSRTTPAAVTLREKSRKHRQPAPASTRGGRRTAAETSTGDFLLRRQRGFVRTAAMENAQPLASRWWWWAGVIALVRPGGDSGSASESAPAAAGTWSRRTAYLVGGKVSARDSGVQRLRGREELSHRVFLGSGSAGRGLDLSGHRFGQLLCRQPPPACRPEQRPRFRRNISPWSRAWRARTPARS